MVGALVDSGGRMAGAKRALTAAIERLEPVRKGVS